MAVGALGFFSFAYSIYQGEEAKDEQQKQFALQQEDLTLRKREADIRAAKARTKTVREARIKAAQVESRAAQTGATQSSAVAGGVASIGSQLASNLSFLNTITNIGQQRSNISSSIASSVGREQKAAGRAQLAGTIFEYRQQLGSLFNGS